MTDNLQVEMKGDKLVLTIDVSDKVKKQAPLSSSGKNKLLYSTRGSLRVPGTDVQVGLNVYVKP